MTSLACNYSPQLVELVRTGEVDLDWIKLSRREVLQQEMAVARPLRPVLAHVYPRAGLPSFDDTDWAQLNREIADCGSPHIGLHFSALPEDWQQPVSDDEIITRMQNHVRLWCEQIDVPLLIENPPYFGFQGTVRCATDPEVITDVCHRTGAGLLLDIAHARVSAVYRKENVHHYLERMPLESVREIHVNGPKLDVSKGYFTDAHEEMADEDYRLLAWVLERCNPMAITLEYGGTGPKMEHKTDIRALRRQLNRMNRMIGRGLAGH